jgi:hypothetical protein
MASLAEQLIKLPRWRGLRISFPPSLTVLLSLLICLATLPGCGNGFVSSLADLARLRANLINEFHDSDVQVLIRNATVLSVTFVNSPLNDESSGPLRMERAQKTASFVQTHYAAIDRIERMWVSFVAAETHFFVFTYSRSVDAFPFDGRGTLMTLSGQPLQSEGEDRAHAVYNASRDETDVQITRLQLSGNLDEGLALAPHFILQGHVTDGHPAIPPAKVVFDFASFASEKIFKKDVSFAIIGDSKTVFDGKASNSSKETEGGNEFLSVELSFDQFSEMTHAAKVVLRLGDTEYPLNASQLEQLRKMASYCAPPKR